jgi:hypothetical protein
MADHKQLSACPGSAERVFHKGCGLIGLQGHAFFIRNGGWCVTDLLCRRTDYHFNLPVSRAREMWSGNAVMLLEKNEEILILWTPETKDELVIPLRRGSK